MLLNNNLEQTECFPPLQKVFYGWSRLCQSQPANGKWIVRNVSDRVILIAERSTNPSFCIFVFVFCICIFVFIFVYFYPAPGVIIPLKKNIHHLQRPLKILIAPSCLIFIFVELSSLSSDFFLDQQSNGCLGVFWNGSEVNDCQLSYLIWRWLAGAITLLTRRTLCSSVS